MRLMYCGVHSVRWVAAVAEWGLAEYSVYGRPTCSRPASTTVPCCRHRPTPNRATRRPAPPHPVGALFTFFTFLYVPRWWVYDGIPYRVKQRAGDRGITALNMEKSQHTDFDEDTTNESASVTCSNIRLWKLDSQKEWRNAFGRFWDERT